MAKNRTIPIKTAQDIDKRVERLLHGLDNPEPPLRLSDVRELLQLDRTFYTADDPSIVNEVISQIRIAGIQVYNRPMLIFDAIRKLSLKALFLPDQRRLIPWHHDIMLGDNELTLSPNCHEQVEAEANFAAGRLLFLRERFTEEIRSVEPSIDVIRDLHKIYGNTLSTTLYRFVESAGTERPIVGMITGHPHVARRLKTFDPLNPCRYFIQSTAFRRYFQSISERNLFTGIAGYCGRQRGGRLGENELILTDDCGDRHIFLFETFFNQYDALTLGKYLKPAYSV